jgi:hypothetical protein
MTASKGIMALGVLLLLVGLMFSMSANPSGSNGAASGLAAFGIILVVIGIFWGLIATVADPLTKWGKRASRAAEKDLKTEVKNE